MPFSNCSCELCVQIFLSISLVLLSIVGVPIYFAAVIIPSFLLIIIIKLFTFNKLPNNFSIFDVYICLVFWPLTALLCYIQMPFIRYKNGYKALYLGTIHRNHLQNNYKEIVNQNTHFIDTQTLNELFNDYNDRNNKNSNKMIRVVCISDTHGRHSWLNDALIPNGTILIHCGDITFQGNGGVKALKSFNSWITTSFTHKYKVIIGGNHDRFMPNMETLALKNNIFQDLIYLDNESITIGDLDGLTIFGCSWSPFGRGSDNHAFQEITTKCVDNLRNCVNNKNKIDILIGHSDLTRLGRYNNDNIIKKAYSYITQCNACVHLCGHFHSGYGARIRDKFYKDEQSMLVVNCSSLDRRYIPVNCPVVFDIQL